MCRPHQLVQLSTNIAATGNKLRGLGSVCSTTINVPGGTNIMSSTFTMSDVARHFGITRSQAYREVQSWPHDLDGSTITFTPGHMTEINRLMNAGPDEQMSRLLLLEQKRRALQTLDA